MIPQTTKTLPQTDKELPSISPAKVVTLPPPAPTPSEKKILTLCATIYVQKILSNE